MCIALYIIMRIVLYIGLWGLCVLVIATPAYYLAEFIVYIEPKIKECVSHIQTIYRYFLARPTKYLRINRRKQEDILLDQFKNQFKREKEKLMRRIYIFGGQLPTRTSAPNPVENYISEMDEALCDSPMSVEHKIVSVHGCIRAIAERNIISMPDNSVCIVGEFADNEISITRIKSLHTNILGFLFLNGEFFYNDINEAKFYASIRDADYMIFINNRDKKHKYTLIDTSDGQNRSWYSGCSIRALTSVISDIITLRDNTDNNNNDSNTSEIFSALVDSVNHSNENSVPVRNSANITYSNIENRVTNSSNFVSTSNPNGRYELQYRNGGPFNRILIGDN